MGICEDGSDVFDGVPSLAPSLARDGLDCHGHVVWYEYLGRYVHEVR